MRYDAHLDELPTVQYNEDTYNCQCNTIQFTLIVMLCNLIQHNAKEYDAMRFSMVALTPASWASLQFEEDPARRNLLFLKSHWHYDQRATGSPVLEPCTLVWFTQARNRLALEKLGAFSCCTALTSCGACWLEILSDCMTGPMPSVFGWVLKITSTLHCG